MIQVILTNETKNHNKYDDPCALCPPQVIYRRQVTCEDFQATKAIIKGLGGEREAYLCADCIEMVKNADDIELVEGKHE